MPADNNLVIKASGALTTTTTGSAVDLGGRTVLPLVFKLNVTSHTGATGTLDVKLQDCDTSGGTFVDCGSYDQVTTVDSVHYQTLRPRRFVKYVATLAGTSPNFTFQIDVVPAGRATQF